MMANNVVGQMAWHWTNLNLILAVHNLLERGHLIYLRLYLTGFRAPSRSRPHAIANQFTMTEEGTKRLDGVEKKSYELWTAQLDPLTELLGYFSRQKNVIDVASITRAFASSPWSRDILRPILDQMEASGWIAKSFHGWKRDLTDYKITAAGSEELLRRQA